MLGLFTAGLIRILFFFSDKSIAFEEIIFIILVSNPKNSLNLNNLTHHFMLQVLHSATSIWQHTSLLSELFTTGQSIDSVSGEHHLIQTRQTLCLIRSPHASVSLSHLTSKDRTSTRHKHRTQKHSSVSLEIHVTSKFCLKPPKPYVAEALH